jgi:hypothetical protein
MLIKCSNLTLLFAVWFSPFVFRGSQSFGADVPEQNTSSRLTGPIIPENWLFGERKHTQTEEQILPDYDEVILHNSPDQYLRYESCARNGNGKCMFGLGVFLAERAAAGLPIKYSLSEVGFLIRAGLCDGKNVTDNSTDGPALSCELNLGLASHYLSLFYEKGLVGYPVDTELARCWFNNNEPLSSTQCLVIEHQKFGNKLDGSNPWR